MPSSDFNVTPAKYIKDYKQRTLWTARLIRLFEDKDLELKPHPESMDTRGQISQIIASNMFTLSLLTDEQPNMGAFEQQSDVSTVKAALASLHESMNGVVAAAEKVTPEFWAGEVEPFGPDWRSSRGEMAYLMMEHETHHRGQLTVYVRMAGKVPPMLYNPVGEEVWEN